MKVLQVIVQAAESVLRFINKLKKDGDLTGPITTQEIQKVKLLWDIYTQ